jgi:hypothetical protein
LQEGYKIIPVLKRETAANFLLLSHQGKEVKELAAVFFSNSLNYLH